MDSDRTTRSLALVCIGVTALAALYAAVKAASTWEPPWGPVAQAVSHLGELAGVIALARSGAAGTGRLAKIGLPMAMTGQVLLTVAELTYLFSRDVARPIFYIAPLLSAVGLILAGVAVLRTRRWVSWRRCTPLLVAGWALIAIPLAVAMSGGPPYALEHWTIVGWEVCWLLLGVAALTQGGERTTPRLDPLHKLETR